MQIEAIVDDGLFIDQGTIIAGVSAKKQKSKMRAIKTAIFEDEEQAAEVRSAIERCAPKSILVLGTSDRMVDIIAGRLGLPPVTEYIHIEDITTEAQRSKAIDARARGGMHVIPAPTIQVRKQFSGYFMSPMKQSLNLLKGIGHKKEAVEKSVVRPTFSYLGGYEISEKVLSDIAACVQQEQGTVGQLVKIVIGGSRGAGSQVEKDEGVEMHILADFVYGPDLPAKAVAYQKRVAEQIEEMTMFNISKVDLEIRKLI